MPTITLTSSTDSITFNGADLSSGFTYRNASLSTWYGLPSIANDVQDRPNAQGAFGWDRLYAEPAKPILTGSFWGVSMQDAANARRRLTGLYADGRPVTMTVADELGTFTRQVNVVDADVPWLPYPNFDFTISMIAADPRRYGPLQTGSTGVPSASSGLVWPLGSTTPYWNWGTAGASGRLQFTNGGNASTSPSFTVSGGSLASGFTIVEVETGRTLTYGVAVATSDTVALDGRNRVVNVNGSGNYTQRLSSRQWFSIPPGATRTYQFVPLGATTGTPTMAMSVSTADL